MAPPPSKAEPGLRLIIAYKLIKGAAALVLAVLILGVIVTGRAPEVRELAESLRHHVVGAWSIWLAERLLDVTTPGHLKLVLLALSFDSSLTLLEGWALHRRWPWAPWLVVVSTSTLLPFEVAALIHAVHLGRALVLFTNVLIVIYLGRRSAREHSAHRRFLEARRAPPRSPPSERPV